MAETDGASIDARLRAIEDRQEICDVLARYFRGVDRGDWELVRDCYHEDALDRHGPLFSGTASAFVDWVSVWLPQRFERTIHIGGQSLIEIDGDHADVETYAVAVHRTHPGDQGQLDLTVGARLLDRFERRDSAWRIAARELVDDWTRFDRVGAGHFSPDALPAREGERRRTM